MVISVPEQRLALLEDGGLLATYPVSTSKFALSDAPGSRGGTPLGELEIARKDRRLRSAWRASLKIVAGQAKSSRPTRRDAIRSSRASSGCAAASDRRNANAYGRYIYIHGTAEERNIGRPASYGCIRMRSTDVIRLFDVVGEGARVEIVNAPLAASVPVLAPVAAPNGSRAAGRGS